MFSYEYTSQLYMLQEELEGVPEHILQAFMMVYKNKF